MRGARYLRPEEVQALQPPRWLLEGFLIEAGLTVLFGAPKSGKSMLSLDWGLNIERGSEWHGRRTRQGSVLYVAGEGIMGIGNRIGAWQREHGSLPPGPLFRDSIVDLRAPAGPEYLLKELREMDVKPALVVIDTLARAMVGGDENSAEDMGRAIAGADKLRHELGAAVLLLHHTTKASDRIMRGSSALLGAADVVLSLVRQRDGATTLGVDAARDFESGQTLDLRMLPVGPSAVLIPAAGYVVTHLTDEQAAALLALAQCARLDSDPTRAEWQAATKLPDAAFKRMVVSLEAYIERVQLGRSAHFRVSEAGYTMLEHVEDEAAPGFDEWEDPWEEQEALGDD